MILVSCAYTAASCLSFSACIAFGWPPGNHSMFHVSALIGSARAVCDSANLRHQTRIAELRTILFVIKSQIQITVSGKITLWQMNRKNPMLAERFAPCIRGGRFASFLIHETQAHGDSLHGCDFPDRPFTKHVDSKKTINLVNKHVHSHISKAKVAA